MKGLGIETVKIGDGVSPSDLLVHNERNPDPAYAFFLSQMVLPEFPVPVGVFRAVEQPTFDGLLQSQIKKAKDQLGEGDLKKLLFSGETWKVT